MTPPKRSIHAGQKFIMEMFLSFSWRQENDLILNNW